MTDYTTWTLDQFADAARASHPELSEAARAMVLELVRRLQAAEAAPGVQELDGQSH